MTYDDTYEWDERPDIGRDDADEGDEDPYGSNIRDGGRFSGTSYGTNSTFSGDFGSRRGSSRRRSLQFVECSHEEAERAPIPMCFTESAMEELLKTVGSRIPETGAKGFGPKDEIGFDVVEFDEPGSSRASGTVYSPDVEWGERRREAHMHPPEGEPVRLWTGDLHSHPGRQGTPSPKSGDALGDLGYVEEVFRQNPPMQWFFIPILTSTATPGPVEIHPWVCRRDRPHTPMIAELRICPVEDFPERDFNPDWLRSIGELPEETDRDDEDSEEAVDPSDTGEDESATDASSASDQLEDEGEEPLEADDEPESAAEPDLEIDDESENETDSELEADDPEAPEEDVESDEASSPLDDSSDGSERRSTGPHPSREIEAVSSDGTRGAFDHGRMFSMGELIFELAKWGLSQLEARRREHDETRDE